MQRTNEEFLELRSQVQQVHRSSSGVASLNSVEIAFCQLNEARAPSRKFPDLDFNVFGVGFPCSPPPLLV